MRTTWDRGTVHLTQGTTESEETWTLAYIQRGGQVLGSVVSQPSQTQRKHPLEPITKSAGKRERGKLIGGGKRGEQQAVIDTEKKSEKIIRSVRMGNYTYGKTRGDLIGGKRGSNRQT